MGWDYYKDFDILLFCSFLKKKILFPIAALSSPSILNAFYIFYFLFSFKNHLVLALGLHRISTVQK
jgi:hypothetical protein